MTGWRPTTALTRALVVAALGLGVAVVLGSPVLVVLTVPFLLVGALALLHRPREVPVARAVVDHSMLHEGQGTACRLLLSADGDVEHVSRSMIPAPYVACHPADGSLGYVRTGRPDPAIEMSPRRWGRRRTGSEEVAFTSPWSGYRIGPVQLDHQSAREYDSAVMFVLPTTSPYDARAGVPQPVGLVGQHHSRRAGSGSEFQSIRPFAVGDRLRRINWRVSLRSDTLHVVSTRGEEDAAVLLVVDALADHGHSEGVDGSASSLDVTVRAAAAIAEHHVRTGDRVALRVIGAGQEYAGFGGGQRHLRRIQGTLAGIRPGEPRDLDDSTGLRLGVTAGTIVIVLSPMLSPRVAAAAATLSQRGLAVTIVDTLPFDLEPHVPEGVDARVAALAWRMRRLERDAFLAQLAGTGCPVVRWRGPGTLDEVLTQLARRGELPRVVSR